MPTSTMSPPRRTISGMRAAVVARSGSPAVRNGMSARRPSARRRANRRSIRFMGISGRGSAARGAGGPEVGRSRASAHRLPAEAGDLVGVLVAPAGEADDQHLALAQPRGLLHGLRHGVAG